MKTKVAVNIDTVEFIVKGPRGCFSVPGATTARVINADGEVLNSYENRTAISGQFGAHNINVRALHSGEHLQVHGSPYAWLYGQNVYTSSDMKTGVISALKKVCEEFGIKPTADQKRAWLAGDVGLDRVDLAVNFRFASEAECMNMLRQIRRQLEEQRGSTKTDSSTVYWTPRDGKEYSICFYAKGPQMRRQKRFNHLPGKDKLLEECSFILRVEVRLRAEALRKLNLEKVSMWNEDSAQRAFATYMRRLRLLSVTSGPVTAKELDDLPHRRLRPVLALHKAGCALDQVYSRSSLQRHRADFRKQGIDLRCPSQPTGTVIPLSKVLSPSRAIKCPPAWMQEGGLVPANTAC